MNIVPLRRRGTLVSSGRRLLVVLTVAVLVALVPSVASAQQPDDDKDVLIRIRGDVVVSSSETIGRVIVVDGDAIIEGTVVHDVLVISGNAIVSGSIGDNLTVISGDIDLRSGAEVRDVHSIRGDLTRASGATVTGEVNERDGFDPGFGALALLSVYFWLATTVLVVVIGLVFAAVGGDQLTRASAAMTGELVNTIVAGVFFWIGLPILAALLLFTIVGIPVSLTILIVALPAMMLLGYVTAGARLGSGILGRFGRESGNHPYAATTLGIVILQLILIIPIIGLLIAFVAAVWGASSLVYVAYSAAGGPSFGARTPQSA
jgi:hypothetical protein